MELEIISQCPLYASCRTGRDLPPEFCAKYRCNTFYQIDTISRFNQANEAMKNANGNIGDIREIFRGYNGRKLIGKRWFESASAC